MNGCYPCNNVETYSVWLDGKQVSSGTVRSNAKRDRPAEFRVHFAGTQPHAFRMEYSHQSPLVGAGVTFSWKPPVEALRQQAVADAQQADAVVAFVGISPNLEGEEMPIHVPGFSGGDRTSIDLPEVQQQMLQAVAATGKPLIVVLMNGSALAVNWSQQHANAILEAWYPGARGGEAIVNTLLGKNNPAGRLPLTFYTSTSQLPPFEDYSMTNRTYRYFRGTPLYGFGYGLSYSNFKFGKLHVSTENLHAGDPLTVDVDVTNTSKIAGDEVAEVYLSYPTPSDGNGADDSDARVGGIFARACSRRSDTAGADSRGCAAMEPGAGRWRPRDSAGRLHAVCGRQSAGCERGRSFDRGDGNGEAGAAAIMRAENYNALAISSRMACAACAGLAACVIGLPTTSLLAPARMASAGVAIRF